MSVVHSTQLTSIYALGVQTVYLFSSRLRKVFLYIFAHQRTQIGAKCCGRDWGRFDTSPLSSLSFSPSLCLSSSVSYYGPCSERSLPETCTRMRQLSLSHDVGVFVCWVKKAMICWRHSVCFDLCLHVSYCYVKQLQSSGHLPPRPSHSLLSPVNRECSRYLMRFNATSHWWFWSWTTADKDELWDYQMCSFMLSTCHRYTVLNHLQSASHSCTHNKTRDC